MEMIEIKNNLARPVIFRVPGSSIRLGPGESTSLPAAYADTPEFNQLRLKQVLSVIPRYDPEESTYTVPAGEKTAAEDGKPGKRGKTKSKQKEIT